MFHKDVFGLKENTMRGKGSNLCSSQFRGINRRAG